MELWDHQKNALAKMHNGSVLVGGTGSGKSRVAVSYYKKVLGDSKESPIPLYVVTTAKKRDEKDWDKEANVVGVTIEVTESWNNIKKLTSVRGALFIFDEQRLVGSGVWVRSFYKIAKQNQWILLSATPADTWMDLIPVFVANGFYKNRTAFIREHVRYAPFVTFPKIIGYLGIGKLERNRDQIFVLMPAKKHTTQHIHRIKVDYNSELVSWVLKNSWNPFTNRPIEHLSEETFINRKIINMAPARVFALLDIHEKVGKLIVFYNFNFELEILRLWFSHITTVAEWNGFRHDPIPDGDNWVYLVQYAAAEAWECFTTNHMAFYSLNYSYRKMHQARGRIDRHNTPYNDVHYYELVSDSYLDKAIVRAYGKKVTFNINMLKSRKKQR